MIAVFRSGFVVATHLNDQQAAVLVADDYAGCGVVQTDENINPGDPEPATGTVIREEDAGAV